MFIVLFWAKNIVSKTIHTPLSPKNLLFNELIRITGKNGRKTSYKSRNATNLSRFVFYNKLNVINTIDAEKLRNKFFK